MQIYKNIEYVLKTIFVVDLGFSEEMAIRLYKESLQTSGKIDEMRQELRDAFEDKSISWKKLLLNDDYEVIDLNSEDEAREFVKRVLCDPIGI